MLIVMRELARFSRCLSDPIISTIWRRPAGSSARCGESGAPGLVTVLYDLRGYGHRPPPRLAVKESYKEACAANRSSGLA